MNQATHEIAPERLLAIVAAVTREARPHAALPEVALGEGNEAEQREARALRQRQASELIDQLLARIGHRP